MLTPEQNDLLTQVRPGTPGGNFMRRYWHPTHCIRIPSAWCGVYGYKASFGRVPILARPNAFGASTPFVFEGPITRNVEDAALALLVVGQPVGEQAARRVENDHVVPLASLDAMDGRQKHQWPLAGVPAQRVA